MTLTDDAVLQAEPRVKPYELWDGDGLCLLVLPRGSKGWRYAYRLNGRRRFMSLGTYPTVSLGAARSRASAKRLLVKAGRDPLDVHRVEVRQERYAAVQTVEAVTREWLGRQQKVFAPATLKRITYLFEAYVFKALGTRLIASIEPADVLEMLQPIEGLGKLETMHRTKQLTSQVLRYAIATGRARRDATTDLRGALLPVRPKHYAALTDPRAVAEMLGAIDTIDGSVIVRTALQLTALVFVRPGELRLMTWREVDLAARRWIIPAARMKMRRDHIVPLSRQAVALLQRMAPITGVTGPDAYVFPTVRRPARPMSDSTLAAALSRIGYDREVQTVHGFRATARTLLHEQLNVNPDVIELQLAHRTPGALGATYNRGQFLPQRTEMMQQWADYLDTLRAVPLALVK